ncbi:MAG: hypothetical protein QXV64_00930 [Candidatus Anstonellaceae archaeon]
MNSILKPHQTPAIDKNLLGWESIVRKWGQTKYPRRPSSEDLKKIEPLVSKHQGQVAIFGATPEFRYMLAKISFQKANSYDLFLIEKSDLSFRVMNSILKKEFKLVPKKEQLVSADWEEFSFPKNQFSLLLGDTILGYLQTKERLEKFLNNCYYSLEPRGSFILREFLFDKKNYLKLSPKEVRYSPLDKDKKRWAYIFIKGFATENGTFNEEKLTYNLLHKVADTKVFRTCADPPRIRLLLNSADFEKIALNSGFKITIISPQKTDLYPHPAILELKKY